MESAPANPIIPTGFKSKLPQALSYPIGAEILSAAFAGVPQFDLLNVDFFFYSKMRPEVVGNYPVLELRYWRGAKTIHTRPEQLENGVMKRSWSIMVRPVPRVRRHLIRTQLTDAALPAARAWLDRNAGCVGEGSLELTYLFDEETQLLIANETPHLGPERSR